MPVFPIQTAALRRLRQMLRASVPAKALHRVGDLFMSLIHTREPNKVNPFDYLTELLRHPADDTSRNHLKSAPASDFASSARSRLSKGWAHDK